MSSTLWGKHASYVCTYIQTWLMLSLDLNGIIFRHSPEHICVYAHALPLGSESSGFESCFLFPISLSRAVGPTGPFFPSCLPGTLLNTATYAQALSHVASLKGKSLCLTSDISSKSSLFMLSGILSLKPAEKPLGNVGSFFLLWWAVIALTDAAGTGASLLW